MNASARSMITLAWKNDGSHQPLLAIESDWARNAVLPGTRSQRKAWYPMPNRPAPVGLCLPTYTRAARAIPKAASRSLCRSAVMSGKAEPEDVPPKALIRPLQRWCQHRSWD